ncbi:Mu-like prophage tail sheath protein [Rhizobium phaseoli]|uniref:phage tail protein n=1 Tax=Rhizobium phaseoli TaxID=396 RepID=UPI0007EB09EF|nr:phage tail protein [Rhizobium phaseoli]ANM05229.1 Mu-like prophage tail sheath protein [Rhizobium phaseoli]
MDFNEIPYDWLEPATLLEVKPNYANVGILPFPTKALIVAHSLATGSLQPGQIVEVTRGEEGVALCGRGSIGAEQIAAFRKANMTSPLYVTTAVDAAGAVKASGTFTFVGAVTQATVLRFKVAGRAIRITVNPADTVTVMAAALATAINADLDNVVTAASALGVVTCTARNGGEVGNGIDLRVDSAAAPVPSGLTITVVDMANGAGNPVLQTVLDVLANTWFTDVIIPWGDATNMAAFAEWLRVRYTATSKLDVHGYVGKRGTYGGLGTFGMLTNSPNLTAMGLNRPVGSPWVLSALVGALCCFHLTNDPARQLRSLVVPGFEGPLPADQFTDSEQNLLLNKGICTFDHLSDGSTVISRIITTYKTSSLGILDRAWLDIMTPKTLSRIRYDWAAYVSLQYPRSKLVDDESGASFASRFDTDEDAGSAVVTPRRMHASWGARCKLYGDKVWIEDVQATVKASVFQRSADDKNRLESRQQIKIVGNLMVLAGSLEFQV